MSNANISFAKKIDPGLLEAARTIATDPARAERQLRDICKFRPEILNGPVYLARALRMQRKFEDAVGTLTALTDAHPEFAIGHYELALAFSDMGARDQAEKHFRRTLEIDRNFPNGWLALADLLFKFGNRARADEAYMAHVEQSGRASPIRSALKALQENKRQEAAAILARHLKTLPTDVAAMGVLGEIKGRLGEYAQAAALFEQCLERVPSFGVARLNYATTLYQLHNTEEALIQIRLLLQRNPTDPRLREQHAAILFLNGNSDESIKEYKDLLAERPDDHKALVAYGHVLRSEGMQKEAFAAYRRAAAIDPRFGEAVWGIANMKTGRHSQKDVARLKAVLADESLPDEDRVYFHFTLGKALEDQKDYAAAFANFEKGNALKLTQISVETDLTERRVQHWKTMFTPPFFEARRGAGDRAADPIFIVGMPRSGSTLIEQILASHSAIEGTAELLTIRNIVRALNRRGPASGLSYPDLLELLPLREFAQLGASYIADTRRHRRTDRPFFTDKMPANFQHIGLINLLLPNAKIIDCRRHPLGCCLSNFKQLYAHGQSFSYDQTTLGQYYAGYVEMMAQFDAVLPGRIHRIFYEDLVADPEREIRRLLDYCGVAYEPACLSFHETERRVRTISSEQVRRPIFSDGVNHWRNYEPWLGPLKAALGPVLDAYPAVPRFGHM